MSEENSSRTLTITDAGQARLIVHPEFSRIVDALIGRELSISALSGQVKLPLDTVHYRVKKLVGVGLLRVVREEKRAAVGRRREVNARRLGRRRG